MFLQKVLSVSLVAAIIGISLINTTFASDKILREPAVSLNSDTDTEEIAEDVVDTVEVEAVSSDTPSDAPVESCSFESPEDKIYDAQFITVRRTLKVSPGEAFRVKAFVKNDGNTPWFSGKSTCAGSHMSLGTDNGRDLNSTFYSATLDGWEESTRIGMDQLRVDPGEIASFTFYAQAGDEPDVYKAYFTPVIEAVTWIDDASFSFEVIIGEVAENSETLRTKMLYAGETGSVLDINLDGEKSILVDLSDQQLFLMLDDVVIRKFRVSTGAPATPTPTGVTSITLKQEIRVGGKAPHYIMPNFMWFRAGGYGLHALPSLGNDGGWFWTEARDHIGIPVSHGCIRMLPEDSDFAFEFAEIGTTVTVQY